MSSDNGATQMVAFHSHGTEYAMELQTIQEIVRQGEITNLPAQPAFIEGIINLRGRVVPIMDLASKFDEGGGCGIKDGKILVVHTGGRGFGVLVDTVSEVFSINETEIEPMSGMIEGGECLTGIVKVDDKLLTLLDPMKLLSSDEINSLDNSVVSEEELDDGNVLVTKKEWGVGGEHLTQEIVEKGQILIDKKDMEGEGVENMRATLEEVQKILEGFGEGDLTAVEQSIDRLNVIADKRLFNEVGKVTRNLHTSLKDFQSTIDPGVKKIVQEGIPEATDQLAQIVEATERSANRTIEMVEAGHSAEAELKKKCAAFRTSHDKFKKGDGDDAFLDSTEEFIASCEGHIVSTTECFTEILVAQSFQDLTGQAIKKVIPVVREVENQLLHLIKTFSIDLPDEKAGEKYATESSTKVDQGDVDDMLAGFGF